MKTASNSFVSDETTIPLIRILGLTSGIMLVAGNIIGSGVFIKITPMAASGLNENHIIAAWIVAGIITMFGAFTIAGLATMTTESGGQYEYLRLIFGDFVSFLFGWTSFAIIGSAGNAAVGFIFAESLNTIVPLHDPLYNLKEVSIGQFIYPFANSGVKIFTIATIIILTWVNYRGTKKGTTLNNVVTFAKILGILLIILLGFSYVPAHTLLHDNANARSNLTGTVMVSAFFAAMLSAFWAFSGWADVTFITGEIKNPKRNVPIAIIAGVGIVIFLYVLVNYAYMRALPLKELASIDKNNIPAAAMAGKLMGKTGTVFIAILIMISTFSSLNVGIIIYPRLYFKMAREGFFFKKASNVHPVFRTPYVSLIHSMIWTCVLVVSGTFDLLSDMVVFTTFLFYGLLAWGLIKMKRKGVITAKVIGYPIIPVIVILFSAVLLINTIMVQPKQTLFGISLILTGIPFYFYFRRKNVNA